jgi:hypothetical protein
MADGVPMDTKNVVGPLPLAYALPTAMFYVKSVLPTEASLLTANKERRVVCILELM